MGWRDTQAKIESGELDYRRPARSNSDYFFEAATSSFSDAFRARKAEQAADKRYARDRADKLADEERTDARALARENESARKRRLEAALAEAKQEEKVIRERRTKAKKLLQQNGRDDTNPNFMQFAMDHLQAYGDSYSDAEDKFTELNKRITEVGPMQGPLLRRSDVDLDVSFDSTRDAAAKRDGMDDDTKAAFEGNLQDLSDKDALTRDGYKDEMNRQMDAILGPKGDPATVSGVRDALRSGESGGDTEAVDFNKEDGKDHVGLYQFGQARLDDYNNANNTSHTVADLKAMSEEEQEKIADWHFADIETFIDDNGLDKFVGQTVGGVNITRSGLIAMAHLGGNGGMKKFLETDGEYNPDDSSSTVKGNSLAQYAEKFGTSEATTTRSGGLGEGELPEESPYPKFEIDAKPASDGKKVNEYLKDLNSVNEIVGRQTMVRNDTKLTETERTTIQAELTRTMNEMIAQKEQEAERKQGLLMYMPIDEEGRAIPSRAVMGKRVEGGIKTEDGSVVEGNYKFVAQDFVSDFVKFNNDTVEELSDYQSSAANLARDLLDLKGIVLKNPAVTNRFAVAATDVTSFLREGASAFTAFMEPEKSYSYEQALTALEAANLTPQRKEAETLKLRIAYGLARLEGSSGMSLSDKELSAQLESVLASGDPEKALSLIDAQLRGLIERSETIRSTKVDNFLGVGMGSDDTFPNAKWNMPMQDYVRGELGEDRIEELERSLNPDTEYDLSGLSNQTPPPNEGDNLALPDLEDWMNGNSEIEGLPALQVYKDVLAERPDLARGILDSTHSDFIAAGIQISKQDLATILGVTIDE